MTRSSLCTYTNITSNHSNGRGGNSVCKITPHYMCAYWSGRGCADYFAETSRQASSNYCIGVDGDIAMSVDEDDRAWTSSSGWNDRQAITIECGNNSDSSLTDATWNALVNLCVDICQRYGFSLDYTGDQYGSLTEHRMFASTDCPGSWLHANMSRLADEVNDRLDGNYTPSNDTSAEGHSGTGFGGSYTVTSYADDGLNVRTAPTTSASVTGQLPVGYTVVLDDWYISADGYIWGRYTANSGGIRYVVVGRATGKEEDDDFLVKASYQYSLPAGDYTFKCTMNVRSQPSTVSDATIVSQYQAGQSVYVDNTFTKNGYVWGQYTGASSGKTRYVALATADGATKYVY